MTKLTKGATSGGKRQDTAADDDMFCFASQKEASAFLKFVEDGAATETSLQKAMTTTSKVADRFMKKMYLRWKKLALVDKETYTRAVAAQRQRVNSLSVTLFDDDDKMQTKLTSVRARRTPRGAAAMSDAETASNNNTNTKNTNTKITAAKNTKTKITAAGIKPKPSPKAKMNAVLTKAKSRLPRTSPKAKLSVAGGKSKTDTQRTPNTKVDTARSKRLSKSIVAKSKSAAVRPSAVKPNHGVNTARKSAERVGGKLAGIRAPPKTIRTVKKGTVNKTKMRTSRKTNASAR